MGMTAEKNTFTEGERGILIGLVTRHGNVLENKCAYAVSLSKKKNKWKQIGELNSKNTVGPRTEQQLPTQVLEQLDREVAQEEATDIPSHLSFLKKR